MGKIEKMQNAQNNKNAVNLSYIRKQKNKPPLKISGIKDLATLIGPGARKHTLNKAQKKFRRNSHITLAALAAAAFTLYNGVTYSNTYQPNANSTEYSSETETLNKEDVLNHVANRLTTIVYKDNISSIDRANFKITHDSKNDSDTFVIYENSRRPNGEDDKKFSYTKYNSPEYSGLNKRNKLNNNSEISELLDFMIDVYNDQNPSYEDLEKLEKMALKLKLNDFTLSGDRYNNGIIAESEKDSGYEIGD